MMSDTMESLAQKLHAAYVGVLGEIPAWDKLGEGERAAWEAVATVVAQRWPFKHLIGDTVADKYSVHGTIRSLSLDEHGRAGYWLQCLDSAGRPFDYYVEQGDITNA